MTTVSRQLLETFSVFLRLSRTPIKYCAVKGVF